MVASLTALTSINPATESQIERFEIMSPADVDDVLDAARRAQQGWRTVSVDRRCDLLLRLAAALRRDLDRHAARITDEMGKPIAEARAEVEKCAFACEYFAGTAPGFLGDESVAADGSWSAIHFEPLGVVLACMPWNFPYWQVFRCAVAALVAGNGVVLKHANNVTGCARAIEAAFTDAGFPPDLFRTLVIDVGAVAGVIADPRIAAVSLTGSTRAGESVGAHAGASLKKCVLELGGSDAFVVLDNADVATAATVGARSRFQNCGQSCIAAKRFIVDRAVADQFIEALVARAEMLRMGDPDDPMTQIGPLARRDLREQVEGQLSRSVAMGARHLCGGTRPDGLGYYLTPAVIAGCTPEMPAFSDETFGPLAAVAVVDGDDEAVRFANRSDYGLGAAVFTADRERGMRVARRIDAGGVFINGMSHSDPRLPFGGIKRSGYGRELHRFGLHEFVNVKTVWTA